MPKLNYQKAKQLGYSDDQILQYAKTRGVEVALPESPKQAKKERGLLDLLSVGTSIGGGILGSAIAPGAGTVVGSGLGGALGQFLEQKISGEKTDVGDIVKEGAWSAGGSLAGLGVGKLLAGGAKAATASKILKNAPKGSRYIDKIDDLTETALSKGAPTGSYMDKARGYSSIAKGLKTQRTDLVSGAGGTSKSSLFKSASQIVDTDEIKDLKVLLNRISGSKVSDSKLLSFKEGLNQVATKGTKKGRSAQALQEVIDKVLSKKEGYGGATKQIGKALTLKDTYTEAARQGTKIPLGIGSIPTGPLGGVLQKTGDKITRGAYDAGNNKGLMQLLGQSGTAPFRGRQPQGGDQMPTDTSGYMDGEISGEQSPTGSKKNNTGELLRQIAMLDALQGGKNSTKLLAVAKAIDPPMSETRKSQISQMEGAEDLISQLESAYVRASENGQTGFGVGPLAGLVGKVSGGAIAQDAKVYNQLRNGFTALIARATGEKGVLTDADAERALGLLASLNDTPESAARAFQGIRDVFSNARARLSTQPGGYDMDIMSIIEGLQ